MLKNGKDLKKFREKKGMVAKKLADMIHYRVWSISKIECTNQKLSNKMIGLINDLT